MISHKFWTTLLTISTIAFAGYACSSNDDDTSSTEKSALGADCKANDDCESNFCDAGKCAAKAETPSSKAKIGADCKANADCESDFCDAGKCAAKAEPPSEKAKIGADCKANDDCESDFCDAGKCAAKAEPPSEKAKIGADCKANDDCESDFCDAGKCAAKADGGELDPAAIEALVAAEKALTKADVKNVSEADVKKYGDNLNAFSHEFEAAYKAEKSYVFSPFSYHSALSMAAYGALGDTYDEMAKTIHLDGDKDAAAELNGNMQVRLRFDGQTETSKFEIANRIWVDQTSNVVPAFTEGMNKYYKAPLKVVDFKNNYAKYIPVINDWVSNNTGNMIKNLLKDGDLTDQTRMVLINAIHFDGEWDRKFEYENTHSREFNVSKTQKANVKMMSLHAHQFVYYRSDENKYMTASMDYKGGQFAMLIVLPDDIDGLANVASHLDGAEIRKIMDGQALHNGTISIPKFKIETTIASSQNLEIFNAMGIKKAFVPGDADFKGMITPNEDNPAVHIGQIIHKAIIDVDEEGTKAAAVTEIGMDAGAAVPPDDFVDFVADHPFEFILYHKSSGTILFAGLYRGE
ncbi:MAG: hypothetical protein IJM59_09950 [Proteobacteria bacterium]|nr:hypothetical protein [Pseudomonadota bacterium]